MGIREGGDSGQPAAMQDNKVLQHTFEQLAQQVARAVALRNANRPITKIVEVTV